MRTILECLNKQLIRKYDKYYIRFMGGQYEELICDINITDAEADRIIDSPEIIVDVFNEYRKHMTWTGNTFIHMGLRDYFIYENYPENDIDEIIKRLDKFENIKYEMYESIIREEFPKSESIRISGKTAKDF